MDFSNPSSLLFLLIGKESAYIAPIVLFIYIVQKWRTICEEFKKLYMWRHSRFELTTTIYTNKSQGYKYGRVSKSIKGIMYELKQNPAIKIKKATNFTLPESADDIFEDVNIIPANNSGGIWLTPQIHAEFKIAHSANQKVSSPSFDEESGRLSSKPVDIEEDTLTITLTTTEQLEHIIKYIDTKGDIFDEYYKKKHATKQYIIKPVFETNRATEIQYPNLIPFKTTKTFDNLFFEGKDKLIDRLNIFKDRKHYKTLGIPETLGLLFHGEPGCGKTSTIKAIAHYMEMSVIIVPMNKIHTRQQLDAIFYSDTLQDCVEPAKRIYVFEEIDCNGWEKIVRDRRLPPIEDMQQNITDAVENILTNTAKIPGLPQKKSTPYSDDDKLTLGALLEVLDGIIEVPGRIVIMTTNHRDVLDPALTRPGRIDMEVEFKRLRRQQIVDIFKQWYTAAAGTIPERMFADIPDYKYTQADISQLLFKYETEPYEFITALSTKTK